MMSLNIQEFSSRDFKAREIFFLKGKCEDTAASFEGQCENSDRLPWCSKCVQNKVGTPDLLGKSIGRS